MNKAYSFHLPGDQRGIVVGDSVLDAERTLRDIGGQATGVKLHVRGSLGLWMRDNMGMGLPLEDRLFFYRTLHARVKHDNDMDAVFTTIFMGTESPPMARAVFVMRRAIKQGKSLAGAMSDAGIPLAEVKAVTIGEKTGRLEEALFFLVRDIGGLMEIKKKIIGSISGPLFVLVVAWVVLFAAFAVFLPHMHDMLIASNASIKNSLPAGIAAFFEFSLTVRGALPFSAIGYISLPLCVIVLLRFFNVSFIDILSQIPIVNRFLILLDVLRAGRSIAQHSRFKTSMAEAVAESGKLMTTAYMQVAMSDFYRELLGGHSVAQAARNAKLPAVFTSELAVASGSKSIGDYLDGYCEIVAQEMLPVLERLRVLAQTLALVLAAAILAGIIYVTYVPLIDVAFRTQL